jgi:predicted glutamine amidotransferase
MCRLFGMTAGSTRVRATFWLLNAPDSLERQSRRNVDGSGIGFFDPSGAPVLDKQPEPAFEDSEWIRSAKHAESAQFIAHVRWATAGGRTLANTHPFAMNGRIMAHNGGFGSLPVLDQHLGEYTRLVRGDTDSERFFALITKETDAHDGDVGAGLTAAARWIAANLPLSSLNTIVAAPGELWALRYPDQHALHVIERPSPRLRSSLSTVHVSGASRSPAPPATVVVASEELDAETGWRMLAPGELVHVGPDLTVRSPLAVPDPPAHLIPLPAANPNIDT